MTALEGPLRHSGQRGFPLKMKSKREGTSTLEVGMKVIRVTVLIVVCCYRCFNFTVMLKGVAVKWFGKETLLFLYLQKALYA